MQNKKQKITIVCAGYIVGYPLAGMVLHSLNYVLGLKKLGYDVYFLEDSQDEIRAYNPIKNSVSSDYSYGVHYLQELMSKHGLSNKWLYRDIPNDIYYGLNKKQAAHLFKKADLFINLSGYTPHRKEYMQIKNTCFIDTDPGFTQIKLIENPEQLKEVKLFYDNFFTFGQGIVHRTSSIPDLGIAWKGTVQPIFMDFWKNEIRPVKKGKFTTIMNWKSYESLKYKKMILGAKDVEFMKYMNIPQKAHDVFEVVLGSNNFKEGSSFLRDHGWSVKKAVSTTLAISSYADYVNKSKAEFSVAKNGYVATQTAWFGDRSAYYLAAGKPVILEETGFSKYIPTGKGLFSFSTEAEAVRAVKEVNDHYEYHCREARKMALKYFDSGIVLEKLIRDCKL